MSAPEEDPPPSSEDAVPVSTRDVELEPVSLRDIEMILAPGKAPPALDKTRSDRPRRRSNAPVADAARAEATPPPPVIDEEPVEGAEAKKRKIPLPPRKGSVAEIKPDEVLARTRRAISQEPAEAPRDSGLEDIRSLIASHPPPAPRRESAVDMEELIGIGGADAPPPPPLPPDLSTLLSASTHEPAKEERKAPKPPLKKRDRTAEEAKPKDSERAPRSSRRPDSARKSSQPPKQPSGVPAKSIEPRASRTTHAPAAATKPDQQAAQGGAARMALFAIAAVALLGIGYMLGKGSDDAPAPVPSSAPARTEVSAAPLPTPPPVETQAAPPAPTQEPTTTPSASAAPSVASAAPPPALTGSLPTAEVTAAPTPTATATSKPSASPGGAFDPATANAALNGAAGQASACKQPGDPSGKATVTVTFAPSGRVTTANVNGPPFAGTATGGCIAKTLKGASVPPFSGDPVTVSKTVTIP